MLCQNHLLY